MLATFDKYSNGLITGVLLLYIINTILIQSNPFSIVLFVFFAGFQLLRLRKNIIKLSFIQIGIIIAIFFATIALLVFLFMWLNHLEGIGIISMPDWVMFVIQITIILLFLVALSNGIHKLYLRFTQSKA